MSIVSYLDPDRDLGCMNCDPSYWIPSVRYPYPWKVEGVQRVETCYCFVEFDQLVGMHRPIVEQERLQIH